MTEIATEYASTIFAEMITHPALFTHAHPRNILILGDPQQTILEEVTKHTSIEIIHYGAKANIRDARIIAYPETTEGWLADLKPHAFDVIIHAENLNAEKGKLFFDLLNHNGILVQQGGAPFNTNSLKELTTLLKQMGFSDLQPLSFPQPDYPTGWRCILMALKKGMFKRVREKIIFNKSFATTYYNFDVHKAACVLPEFLRQQQLF